MTIKLTKKRQQILTVVQSSSEAMTASDIHQKLPDIDLVTIYRNLDIFVKEKLIRQVNLGSNGAYYEYQPHPHHHAICNDCEKIIHFTAADEEIKNLLRIKNFEIEEIEVTVKGKCLK